MARTAQVRPGQTLPDMAIEHCGHISGWAEIARLNGLDMTAGLTAGQLLKLPEVQGKRVVKILCEGGWHPAAGFSPVLEGIDFWGIEYDFVIA